MERDDQVDLQVALAELEDPGALKRTDEHLASQSPNHEALFAIALGARTIAQLGAAEPPPTKLTDEDYGEAIELHFPPAGTERTPAHALEPFEIKAYAPRAFHGLRTHFGVSEAEYMEALGGGALLAEQYTNTKPGELFAFTANYRFLVRTLSKSQAHFLARELGSYVSHQRAHRLSLLARFFGLYRVQRQGAPSPMYAVVMGNVFPAERPLHERYDLRGPTLSPSSPSSAARSSDESAAMEHAAGGLARSLHLGEYKREMLLEQIALDCKLLERMEVVDYSLLVGIHFTAPPSDKVEVRPAVCRLVPAEQPQPGGGRLAIERTTTLAQLFGHVDTLAGALPSKLSRHGAGTQEVYFMGIVDICTEYSMRQQLEMTLHAREGAANAGRTSVVDPLSYSKRFQAFLSEHLD